MIPKHKRVRIQKYLDAAKGQECTFLGPTCNHNSETVVACHLYGSGMGQKNHDFEIFFGCSDCHKYYDTYGAYANPKPDREHCNAYANRARIKTMIILHEMGLL